MGLKEADLLDPVKMRKASLEDISKAIRKAGFHNFRPKQLQEMSEYLVDHCEGTVPCDYDVLVKLRGYGHKTVRLLNTEVFQMPEGITPDSHVVKAIASYNLCEERADRKTLNPIEAEVVLSSSCPTTN